MEPRREPIRQAGPDSIDPSLLEAAEVARDLGVDASVGLSSAEAQRRLAADGPNELRGTKPVPAWRKFVAQFTDPLIYLLLAAVVISLAAWIPVAAFTSGGPARKMVAC